MDRCEQIELQAKLLKYIYIYAGVQDLIGELVKTKEMNVKVSCVVETAYLMKYCATVRPYSALCHNIYYLVTDN